MESRTSMASSPGALPYYVAFSQLLGLMVVAMTGAWLGLYRGGIAWEGTLQFNVHPLCMVIGLVFLQGDALLVYRVFRNEAKRTTKVLHGLLHVFAFIIALVGLVAVFDYHRKKGYADLYSLHSWCGMLVFVLCFVQPGCPWVGHTMASSGPGTNLPFFLSSGWWALVSSCSPELRFLCGTATAHSMSSLVPPSSSSLWAQPCWA
ncbi:cytochrome b561 [Rhinolophus ferrumequinum]|uniref:Transmembrane ascorbate-dependent reductase CYB561 n=1 Tax=Rhinolophus ferrumequinum TaxID=59479 RepID=A0A7J7TD05_RHIFE|nr:cytochrome b561 [Rhinolophus ferrumequinum]